MNRYLYISVVRLNNILPLNVQIKQNLAQFYPTIAKPIALFLSSLPSSLSNKIIPSCSACLDFCLLSSCLRDVLWLDGGRRGRFSPCRQGRGSRCWQTPTPRRQRLRPCQRRRRTEAPPEPEVTFLPDVTRMTSRKRK